MIIRIMLFIYSFSQSVIYIFFIYLFIFVIVNVCVSVMVFFKIFLVTLEFIFSVVSWNTETSRLSFEDIHLSILLLESTSTRWTETLYWQ